MSPPLGSQRFCRLQPKPSHISHAGELWRTVSGFRGQSTEPAPPHRAHTAPTPRPHSARSQLGCPLAPARLSFDLRTWSSVQEQAGSKNKKRGWLSPLMGVCGQVITDFFLPQRGSPALDISSTVGHCRSKESKAQVQEPQQSKASNAHMNGSQVQLVSAAWPRPRSQPGCRFEAWQCYSQLRETPNQRLPT